jgi:VWFA-related protein
MPHGTARVIVPLFWIIVGVMRSAAGAPEPLREYVKVIDRPYLRIGLTVTVSDRQGRPVRGLGREDFRVFEDGAEMALMDYGVEGDRRDRPLSVAVLLDLSGSMAGQVKRVGEAARALLSGLRPGDEVMVAKFNDQLTVLLPFTGDPDEPGRTLKGVGSAWGGTAIFRSIEHTLKDLRDRPGRKVILVVSDGLDNQVEREGHILQSLYIQDLLRLCLRTQTTVYGIRPGMAVSSWLPFEGFVDQTGGRLLYTGGDLERLFARLGEEFLSQYYLAYDVDPKTKSGKRRRIRVEVTRPGAVVRAMAGYFTPRSHVETLLRDLRDDDARLRADAAYELGFIGDPRSSRALLGALDDRDDKVRRIAAGSLGRLGEQAALPPLIEMLGDEAPSVRTAASEALVLFGPRAITLLASAVEAGAGRRTAGPRLLHAARLLGAVGDDRAADPLALLLEEGPVEARVAAAQALGDLGLTRGIPPLRGALLDPAPAVRGAAWRSILGIAGEAARPVLEEYLKTETDPALLEAARAALAR